MQIPLVVLKTSERGGHTGQPVTFGVPLPRGTATAPAWIIEAADNRTVVDVRALDRWPDGSIRWMLVDTCMDDSWLDATPVLRPVDTSVHVPTPALTYDVGADSLTIDTGPARFRFQRGGSFPFAQVELAGRPVLAGRRPGGLVATDASGRTTDATIDRITLEHRGSQRASVLVSGTLVAGSRKVELDVRVDVYAGLSVARVRCTVRNPDPAKHPGNYWDLGDPGSVLFKDLSIVLRLREAPGAGSASTSWSPEVGVSWTMMAGPIEIYQDSSGGDNWQSTNHINRERRVPVSFRGYRIVTPEGEQHGWRATPAVHLTAGSTGIGAAMPRFWQNFPKAIETTDETLTVRLFPGQYADLHELQGGEQKTHEILLVFGGAAEARTPLDWCRAPVEVSAEPEWIMASGAVDFLAPLEAGHRALVDVAIDGDDTFEHKREVIDQYGWRHFGDIYGDHEAVGHTGATPLVSHYNNQYDPVLGLGLQFLRTGDSRWWTAMDELAAHVIDIDIYHTTSDKAAYNGGLFWHTYHYGDADTATHRTYPRRNTGTVSGGGPSADHNYPTGLVLHYFLTGDAASREAAVGLAEYVLNLEDGRLSPFRFLSHADTGNAHLTFPDYYGPARASGNSLNALVDGHRLTGDAKYLTKADQLVCRVIHPDDDQKAHRLDEPEYRWFYAMFLQALGKYLHHKAELGQTDRAYAHGRASLLAYARWMAEHEYPYLTRPEKLEFPTETWAAQDIRKTDIFCFAAMHATGAERDGFLERARYFHRTSVETLAAMPTRRFARPVIVLLGSGSLLAWLEQHPTATEPPPTYQGKPVPLTSFVPQRAIAKRRAMGILATGLGAAGVAAAAALYWWLG